ncbi:MAG: hypothetical protein M3P44_01225 [Actinomycetota bacterium]|nr:hypothetical protein [Actinomycetota bacterium]
MSPPRYLRRAVMGARTSSPPEQAAFGALTSFAATIGISRTLNYVRERRRRFPRLRSLTRRASSGPHQSRVRVHHFLPGIAIAFATGATGILNHRRGFWLGLPFGSGVALTLDELPLLLGGDNPYWGHERLALTQGTAAASAAAGLTTRFYRHGARRCP